MKTHLKDSSEPITEGRSQTAICGTEVKDAVFVFMWDESEVGTLIEYSSLRACRICKQFAPCVSSRYIYGICAGEELKERQREREAAV